MFCLATDLGSKSLGEWPREEWIKGWKSISPKWVISRRLTIYETDLRTQSRLD